METNLKPTTERFGVGCSLSPTPWCSFAGTRPSPNQTLSLRSDEWLWKWRLSPQRSPCAVSLRACAKTAIRPRPAHLRMGCLAGS
jgi:hypothetical protein